MAHFYNLVTSRDPLTDRGKAIKRRFPRGCMVNKRSSASSILVPVARDRFVSLGDRISDRSLGRRAWLSEQAVDKVVFTAPRSGVKIRPSALSTDSRLLGEFLGLAHAIPVDAEPRQTAMRCRNNCTSLSQGVQQAGGS